MSVFYFWQRIKMQMKVPANWLFVGAVGCILGAWAYDMTVVPPPRFSIPKGESEMVGVVRDLPTTKVVATEMVVGDVWFADGAKFPGELLVITSLPVEVVHGDTVKFFCAPQQFDLEKRPSAARMVFLEDIVADCRTRKPILIVSHGELTWRRVLFLGKAKFRKQIQHLFPEPDASLLMGLLSGDDAGIPPKISADFRATGTSHIMAVSGYNVTKLSTLLMLGFALLRITRRWAALWAILAVAMFVLFTGASASVVRAGVMGSLALMATVLGRRYSANRALVLAAAGMLVISPLILRYDLGFGLSFAAVWGLMAFGGAFGKLLSFLPESLGLRGAAAETAAATLATLPLSLFSFGKLPLVGIGANLLVLPMVPWAMAFGFLAFLFSLISDWLALPFSFVASLLAKAILGVIHFIALYAPAPLSLQLGFWSMMFGYVLLAALAFLLHRFGYGEDS